MNDIKCPHDLNQFLLGEPIFENTFSGEECEQKKFYGDCYHCFSTAIAKRDNQLKNTIVKNIRAEIEDMPKTYPFVNHLHTYVREDDVRKILDNYNTTEKYVTGSTVVSIVDRTAYTMPEGDYYSPIAITCNKGPEN